MADAHLDRLLDELGERARADIAAVDAETAARIETLGGEEQARRDAARHAAVEACEQQAAGEQARAMAAMKRERRAALLTAQHALVGRVLDRVRGQLADCFEHGAAHAAVTRRVDALREFAHSGDVEVNVTTDGITVVADGGHLRILDTIDAWLTAERPRLSIEICRMLESTTWPIQPR